MKGRKLQILPYLFTNWRRFLSGLLLLACLFVLGMPPAFASLNDDRYDGNIFVVYAGNGSLVPPRIPLATALKEHKPALLVFYVDDSSDCKQYAIVVSRVQAFYGMAAEIIPISVDSMPSKQTYDPTEPGYYSSGGVPQVVVFNQSGQVVLNKKGQVPYEEIDDKFREVFDLLPRSESVELKRRSFNELNSELTE
ncbi:thylakoid membrane photosystem I accumulation factor [Fischerella sp. PCC 9605]|uniref:thylakoid membrane photosystem I accumulation factor n=1 Tax=Fischerella sp. PCC 9605 TaxID=1173024 RepID=UPI00047D2ADC|nr:thylakoid membrane photosystem I accumulation factor [Fischerella sp. PCC 9605]